MASNDEQRSATTILTTAAQSIAARLIANETTAKFTKAEISTTNLFNQSVTELQVLTSLDNVQQTADINTVTVINNNAVNVNVAIDQTKAPNNYQMNSVGLFAVDGDGKEVLYSVTVLKDPVYIHQDAMGSALGIDLETVVGQASNVEISVNPAGAVTNEILKAALADYVKTDDVKSLIPATIIDGSKPADFKESVTLEKGAVDGEGNAIATSKDVSDGDATTLKSAKDYADTQASDKVKTSDIDPSVIVKYTLTADDDVLTLDSGTYYTLGVTPKNYPTSAVNWSHVVVKTLSNGSTTYSKIVEVFDTSNHQIFNIYSGYPLKWSGWLVPNSTTMASKSDVTTATANMVHRNPDTGSVSEPVDFTNLTVNGGKSVATRDDLKSLETSAWRVLDNKCITAFTKYNTSIKVDENSLFLVKIDEVNKRVYMFFTILGNFVENSSIYIDLTSIVKNLSFPSYHLYYLEGNTASSTADGSIVGNRICFKIQIYDTTVLNSKYSSYMVNANDAGWIYSSCFVNYDELV
ncbi:hypothetical protein ACN50E_09175 [Levilactobacillus brevis]|uniref:hypothetical protein n=1 Tax=Levilactobacillus brevis TaxID=1580 RepID=UPI003AFA94FD